jgi:hypothetical protein
LARPVGLRVLIRSRLRTLLQTIVDEPHLPVGSIFFTRVERTFCTPSNAA